jgi:replicative DNA helicase
MSKTEPLLSEADELDSLLRELESQTEIREIAGWESGFPSLSHSLNGILPGLHLIIAPPSCGKTALAKQLCDQIAEHNHIPVVFFSFGEGKKQLRVRTLARLSGLENRAILRGSSFLLHWYGAPKSQIEEPERLPPSWERLKQAAEKAREWLDLIYLFECNGKTDLQEITEQIARVKEIRRSARVLVVIDDSQRMGFSELPFDDRLPIIAERLQEAAIGLQAPVIATWPDTKKDASPFEWVERVSGAEVVLFMESDPERTKKLTEPNRAMNLHVVKNRGGEKETLAFDFFPASSMFAEALPNPVL